MGDGRWRGIRRCRRRQRHENTRGGGEAKSRNAGFPASCRRPGHCDSDERLRQRGDAGPTAGPTSGYMGGAAARGGRCHGRLPTNRTIATPNNPKHHAPAAAPVAPKSGTLYT